MEHLRFRRHPWPPPDVHPSEPHLTADEMKHNFALQPVDESAFGRPREFVCHCVRCKWTFRVSPDRGSIVAFNNIGEPLEGAEAEKRIATFAEGPCPAFASFPEYEDAREAHRSGAIRDRLQPFLHLLGLD